MKKKVLTIIILTLGIALMIAGVVFICQAGTDHCGYGGGVSRASTSIKFGADFYTSSAQYTGLAANAVIDLYELMSMAAGIFFVFAGAVEICVTLLLTDVKAVFKKEETVETEVISENIVQ